jgi:hypothetical protein
MKLIMQFSIDTQTDAQILLSRKEPAVMYVVG